MTLSTSPLPSASIHHAASATGGPRGRHRSPGSAPLEPAALRALIKSLLDDHMLTHRPDFTEPLGDDMSFDYMGLDSLARVELLGQLERRLDTRLDPTAAFDYVTVRALSEYIGETLATPRPQASGGAINAMTPPEA